MSQQQVLKRVVGALDAAGVEYMITGSVVSCLQGRPRSTHDIDFLLNVHKENVASLVEAFNGVGFVVDEKAVIEAIGGRSMFNLLDADTADTVDLWILKHDPFDRSRFKRRYIERFEDIEMYVSSPEDTILAKLRWAKLSGGRAKHLADAVHVYEVQHDKLDVDYIAHWVRKLGIGPLWNQLIDQAQPLEEK